MIDDQRKVSVEHNPVADDCWIVSVEHNPVAYDCRTVSVEHNPVAGARRLVIDDAQVLIDCRRGLNADCVRDATMLPDLAPGLWRWSNTIPT